MPRSSCKKNPCDKYFCYKFDGDFLPREQQILDDVNNTRVYNIDLSYSSKALFRVAFNNPNAVLNLFVYNKNSYFTGQVGAGQPNLQQQLATTFHSDISNNNPLEVKIKEDFIPGNYTVRIVLVSSPTPVNFTLCVQADKLCDCRAVVPQDNVFCGFWQGETKGESFHMLITKRCDGKLYVESFVGHITTGFQKVSYYYFGNFPNGFEYFILEKVTDNTYRFQPNPTDDDFYYFCIDQTNANALLFNKGGGANPVGNTLPSYFTRLPNYEAYLVDFNDSNNYQSPVEQLDIYTNQLISAQNVQVNINANTEGYPGLGKMLNDKKKIQDQGLIIPHEGLNIWPEPVYFPPEFTVPLENPITTYAGKTLDDVSLLIMTNNIVAYYDPSNTYEVGMTIKLQGILNASSIGIANEWLNIYYLFVGFVNNYCYLRPIQLTSFYPINAEIIVPELKVIPYSFKLTHNQGFRLLDEYNNRDAFLINLTGFTGVGGLDASIFNRRFAVAYSVDNNVSFITLPPGDSYETDPVATITQTGGGIGNFDIAFYPFSARLVNMYNYNSIHLNPDPITIFFTDEPVLGNPYTEVVIEGLAGDYQKLNGRHRVHWFLASSNMKNNKEIWKEGFDSKNRKYYTPVAVDSTDLPSFNPEIHTANGKNFSLTHIVNPVHEDSGYGDFAGAACYFMNNLSLATHSFATFWQDNVRGLRNPSWQSIQEILAMGLRPQLFVNSRNFDLQSVVNYSGRTGTATANYLSDLNKDAYGVPGNAINPDLRYDCSVPPYRAIGNQAAKYIDNSTLHNVYVKISGQTLNQRVPGSDPLDKNISNQLISLGANANGTILNYETYPSGQIIDFGLSLLAPFVQRFLLTNSFAVDGFVQEQFIGDLILANPILADGPLQPDCLGKIVIILRGNVSFQTKMINAFNAGAKGVIIFNNSSGPLINASTGGYNPGIPLYGMSGVDGNILTGFMGGSPIDINNYTMPTAAPTGYNGVVGFDADISARRLPIGPPNFVFGKIRTEFSNDKNIGYVYIPDSVLQTNLGLEKLTEFRDIYGVTTEIDIRAKMWNSVLQTVINGVKFSNMDSIIFDNSNNTGGFVTIWNALASFFGDDRFAYKERYCLADNGLSPALTEEEMDVKFPYNYPIKLQREGNVNATKYQTLYPGAAFTGKKVVHLTSTVAFSAGDVYVHYWRKRQGNYKDIGKGIESILIGSVDGRIYGYSNSISSYSLMTKTSAFYNAQSINQQYVPITSYEVGGETATFSVDAYSGKSIGNQLPYTKIDGLNDTGPIDAWSEGDGGFYQASGFSTPYLRDTPQYQVFNNIIGLPQPYNLASIHYPWLEDAILTANQ
jgi:hypothetical protein